MSSQRGNIARSRPQKHKNANAFKNNMHDTSKKTQMINSIEVVGCCGRCKDQIDWKIKYKKYKPLTVPKKCTSCQEKTVKRAYYILCDVCVKSSGRCGKCGQQKEHAQSMGLTEAEEATQRVQLEQELRHLPERKRRTFYRQQESGQPANLPAEGADAEAGGDAESNHDDSDGDEIETSDGGSDVESCDEAGDGGMKAGVGQLRIQDTQEVCS